METNSLTIWNIIFLFGAGAAAVALGAIIAGFLAYKIKYAGKEMFHEEHNKSNAESFIIDDDFLEDDEDDPTAPENQKPILDGNKRFVEQFARDRIIAAGNRSEEEAA